MLTVTELAAHFGVAAQTFRYAITTGFAGWPVPTLAMAWYEPAHRAKTAPGVPHALDDTWVCARCVRLSQPCYAGRSTKTRALCTDCVAELAIDGTRWCTRGHHEHTTAQASVGKTWCKVCERERQRKYDDVRLAWQRAHPEEERARKAAYFAAHRERIAAQARERDRRNPEASRATWRAEYRQNRALRCASAARWRVRNPERVRAYNHYYHQERKLRVMRGVKSTRHYKREVTT